MAVAGFVITCSSCRVLSISFLNDDTHACRVCVDCLHQAMQVIQSERQGTPVVCCTSARMARDHCGNPQCGRVCPQYGNLSLASAAMNVDASSGVLCHRHLCPNQFAGRGNPSNTQCQRAEMNRTTEKNAVGEHSEQVRSHTGCKTSAKKDHAANLHTVTLMAPIGMRPRKRL